MGSPCFSCLKMTRLRTSKSNPMLNTDALQQASLAFGRRLANDMDSPFPGATGGAKLKLGIPPP